MHFLPHFLFLLVYKLQGCLSPVPPGNALCISSILPIDTHAHSNAGNSFTGKVVWPCFGFLCKKWGSYRVGTNQMARKEGKRLKESGGVMMFKNNKTIKKKENILLCAVCYIVVCLCGSTFPFLASPPPSNQALFTMAQPPPATATTFSRCQVQVLQVQKLTCAMV